MSYAHHAGAPGEERPVIHVVEIATREGLRDAVGEATLHELREAGLSGAETVRFVQIYHIDAEAAPAEIDRAARELLSDPVAQVYAIGGSVLDENRDGTHVLVVRKKPGVMDPVERSVRRGLAQLDIEATAIRTARKYVVAGDLDRDALDEAGRRVLANDVIEDLRIDEPLDLTILSGQAWTFSRTTVPVREAGEAELLELSRKGMLALNAVEMRAIQEHFRAQDRDPTDVELETIAQTWSEHCKHKTLTGLIRFDGREIDNLLRTTIMDATVDLDLPWCLSVFKDNAGIIALDDENAVCFKVETHNHPSAIEPYGGAGTGIGGVIRDILGAGLGARPILNTDVFCFGPPDMPREDVPKGALHPRRVMRGVVSGVRDYGNRMGIPTANGALYFDPRYTGNPLVYCGTVGIMPRDCVEKESQQGDHVVLVGGRTGRDGIHGVTFASIELEEESEMLAAGAVQIGDPITEKKVLDCQLRARDLGLYTSVNDCGGGGLSSAVGEMGEELGVVVDLDRVPLKYDGLSAAEIWISEAQERMVFSVPAEKVEEMLAQFAAEDVEATDIGEFTGDHRLRLRYEGNEVADLDMAFLHDGLPRQVRDATWTPPRFPEQPPPAPLDAGRVLRDILSSWNVCSKEWVIRQYDHEVQAMSVVKPLVGVRGSGPGDACVIRPLPGKSTGIAVACGMNPRYGDLDPYAMAIAGVDEALRNVVAVGADPSRVAVLDNFCWGNTDLPERLGNLVRAAEGCRDASLAYRVPFISGKDSLHNEFTTKDGPIDVPPSLLISALAIMEDVGIAITMDLKGPGNLLYVVGTTYDEMGGSHHDLVRGILGGTVPQPRLDMAPALLASMHRAIAAGRVLSAHDLSEGGLAVAAAEMGFAGDIGLRVDLGRVQMADGISRDEIVLFSESNSRFLVEVAPENRAAFQDALGETAFALVGETTEESVLRMAGLGGHEVIVESLADLEACWKAPLAD
jgi:phosphoribosylformylglycinamidine synthase subunit PurSL